MGYVAAALGVASLITGFGAASDAKKAARRQGNIQRQTENIQANEARRQINLREEAYEGDTLQGAAASRVKTSSASISTILGEAKKEFATERSTLNRMTELRQEAIRFGVAATIDSARNSAISNAISQGVGIFSAFNSMQTNTNNGTGSQNTPPIPYPDPFGGS
jgi:hypothetical protein